MEVKIEDNPVVCRIWKEWLEKDKELSGLTKKERLDYCQDYQWLFPKRDSLVELECLYDSVHVKSNREKFRKWFYVVCPYVLSRVHLGENSYYQYEQIYQKLLGKEGCSSEEFPQMVLLVLVMLGYITGLERGYSYTPGGDRNHGYPFIIDKEKLLHWDFPMVDDNGYFITVSSTAVPEWVMTMTTSVSFQRKGEDPERLSWTLHPDWLGERQYQSIASVKVLKEGILESSTWMFNYEDYKLFYHQSEPEQANMNKDWYSYQKLRDLSCGILGGCLDDSNKPEGEGYAGRFYTCMTNMRSDHRHRYLRLDGELVTEVDISSAQPTFLGLLVYKETGVVSEWLRQCLNGTFYEWVKEKTNSTEDRKAIKKGVMEFLYSCYKPGKKPKNKTKKSKKASSTPKSFQKRLQLFLEENEPDIFNRVEEYKRNPVFRKDKTIYKVYVDGSGMHKKKVGKGGWCSLLSYDLVKEEVFYIKRCIHSLPEDMKFWTIHDCICVKESDSLKVKEIMEQVSREMYGEEITLMLKRENTSEDYS